MERTREVGAASLASVMARLAEGDGAALFELMSVYGDSLARTVRGIAAHRNVRLRPDEVGELVTEAAIAVADVAGAWKPDGAPPWIYARGRIAQAVDRHIGQWTDELDDGTEDAEAEAPPAAASSEPDTAEVLSVLAAENRMVGLFQAGLEEVASERDRILFVELGVQVALGDPSPAVTVGATLGMKPAAVRQQARRVKQRLGRLSAEDQRFADLATLPIVA